MPTFDLAFQWPWLFLALPLLLLLPRRRAWLWRALTLVLLVTALAGPTLGRPSKDLAVLVDVSDSLGQTAAEVLADFDFSGLSNAPSYFYFANDATEINPGDDIPGFLERGSTDIARALQVAKASGAKRVLLISDGAESVGAARLALPDVPVDTYYVRPRDNLRLLGLIAPEQASPGETVEVIAVVQSDQEAELTLRPSVGDEALEPITRTVTPGRTPIRFQFQVTGGETVRVAAAFETNLAQPTIDDAQAVDIAVSEREPVLVLNDPALSRLLRTQNLNVIEGDSASISAPLAYSAVILRESAAQFTPGQLELLENYVQNGGGLMMTGGPESFGFGAWYRTPVEEVLPVDTDLRTEVELPLVALVIVMDRSQSMSTGNPSKIDLAKEGAISVVELAYEDDLLGLLSFSDTTDWAFRLRRATDQGKREMLNAILNIGTQGGTVLEPAYREALSTLQQTQAAIKHVIILSDGRLYDGGAFGSTGEVNFNALARSGIQYGITTSTIAIGSSADFARLEAIASAGQGRYYQALDVSTLPQIFTSEALTATRSLLREDGLRPIARSHPLLPELEAAVPTLDAYIASTLKGEAEMLLEGEQGEPILAVSRQGLGRTAALTTDLNAWAGALGNWSELPATLGTVVRWLQARPADYSATVSKEGGNLRVVVDAVKDGAYINNKTLVARYGGMTEPLEQVAPGRYEGRLAAALDGGNLLVVDGDTIVARAQVSAPNAEFETGAALELLQDLSSQTGGDLIPEAGVYTPVTPSEATPIWSYFALAGLAVFLLELILRRFVRPRAEQV